MGLLGSIGGIAGSIFGGSGGGALGGLIGGALDGNQSANGGAGSTNTTRDPWGPAQQYIKDNLATNKSLQDYYAQNPFSGLQQQQYQKLFDTLSNNQAGGNAMLANAQAFMGSRGGKLGPMQAMPTNTKAAPIDWQGMNPYKPKDNVTAPTPVAPNPNQSAIEEMLAQWQRQQAALQYQSGD